MVISCSTSRECFLVSEWRPFNVQDNMIFQRTFERVLYCLTSRACGIASSYSCACASLSIGRPWVRYAGPPDVKQKLAVHSLYLYQGTSGVFTTVFIHGLTYAYTFGTGLKYSSLFFATPPAKPKTSLVLRT